MVSAVKNLSLYRRHGVWRSELRHSVVGFTEVLFVKMVQLRLDWREIFRSPFTASESGGPTRCAGGSVPGAAWRCVGTC